MTLAPGGRGFLLSMIFIVCLCKPEEISGLFDLLLFLLLGAALQFSFLVLLPFLELLLDSAFFFLSVFEADFDLDREVDLVLSLVALVFAFALDSLFPFADLDLDLDLEVDLGWALDLALVVGFGIVTVLDLQVVLRLALDFGFDFDLDRDLDLDEELVLEDFLPTPDCLPSLGREGPETVFDGAGLNKEGFLNRELPVFESPENKLPEPVSELLELERPP